MKKVGASLPQPAPLDSKYTRRPVFTKDDFRTNRRGHVPPGTVQKHSVFGGFLC